MTRNRLLRSLIAMAPLALVGFAATTVAAQTARPAKEPPPLPPGAIHEWIARYHPNVYAGDPHVNAVTIVVDTNSQYVASLADTMSHAEIAAIDSGFAWVAAHNAIQETAQQLVAGRLRVPGADGSQPVYIVDGVRKNRVDSLDADAIETIRFVKGAEAATAYGRDAEKSGAVVATMIHRTGGNQVLEESIRQRLTKLGIQPERVDLGNQMRMQTRAGVFGPSTMNVTVLHLKGGAF